MQPNLLQVTNEIRSSYWFIPSLMAVAALATGAGVIYLDAYFGSAWLREFGWYQSNTSDGARAVLSTIAGSAITVAGVVFSITIVSVSFAAGQYGPRVLANFMRDRGNQITLGTFIATFLYCIVVLRTIRGGPEEREFVPDLAILIALLLALGSISVLIFFIHHVPLSIHANSVVARIGRQLVEAVDEIYPEFIGDALLDESQARRQVPSALRDRSMERGEEDAECCVIRSSRTGYIEAIDDERLMEIARDSQLVMRLDSRPGEFIHRGRVFLRVWPKCNASAATVKELEAAFAVGAKRTSLQDTRFLVDELVEVGARALSPGINDPFTAIACLDWLGAALSELGRREIASHLRTEAGGAVRVIAIPFTFADYVSLALGQFRPYLAGDRNAAVHGLLTIERILADCHKPTNRAALLKEADALLALAHEKLSPSLSADIRLWVERRAKGAKWSLIAEKP